eukprot:3321559-Pyramimonas_sp.AAC.1
MRLRRTLWAPGGSVNSVGAGGRRQRPNTGVLSSVPSCERSIDRCTALRGARTASQSESQRVRGSESQSVSRRWRGCGRRWDVEERTRRAGLGP